MGIILSIIQKLAGGLFTDGATKAGGLLSGLSALGAIVGAVAWLFGPGREIQITLNALELSGVALGGSVLLEWFRRMPPPGSPPGFVRGY